MFVFVSGNFCTVCLKCYEEFDSSMMQCARCAHWVHPRCEGLTGEISLILIVLDLILFLNNRMFYELA